MNTGTLEKEWRDSSGSFIQTCGHQKVPFAWPVLIKDGSTVTNTFYQLQKYTVVWIKGRGHFGVVYPFTGGWMGWDHVGAMEEESKVIIAVSICESLRFRLFCIPTGPPGRCRSP